MGKHVWRKVASIKPDGEKGKRVRTWKCSKCGKYRTVTKPCPSYLK